MLFSSPGTEGAVRAKKGEEMPVSSKIRARALCAAASSIAIGAGALALPASAFAQQNPNRNGGNAVQEVIVTAQKRSENLQKIPLAVTAFTAQQRDKSGLVSAQQILNFTPGVTYDPSTDHLDIRGVGRVTTYIGTDPGVAVYQDGFYVFSASQLNQSTLLEQRTEILRGPQGTLYGRNSIGGAVNIISRRPDDEYTGEIRASANDYMGETVEARVSGPVTDWLKLSAYFQENSQTHGYYTDVHPLTAPSEPSMPALVVNGNTEFPATPAYPAATCASLNFATVQPLTCNSFKGLPSFSYPGTGWVGDFQASFNPTPSFDGWVKVNFQHQFSSPPYATGITEWDPVALTVPNVWYGFQPTQNPGLVNQRDVTLNEPETESQDQQQFITQDTWHASGFDVKFIGGYWKSKYLFQEDGDSVPIPDSGEYVPTFFGTTGEPLGPLYNPVTGKVVSNDIASPSSPTDNTVINPDNLTVWVPSTLQAWSTELDVASTDKGPLQWLFGAFYYNEYNQTDFTYQENDSPQYNNDTDYLFNAQAACYPIMDGNTDVAYSGPGTCYTNYSNTTGAPVPKGTAGSTAYPTGYLGQDFGYSGTVPSVIDNSPGGALNKAFGFSNFAGSGSGCLYCYDAVLTTQSEALFGQLDWRPNDQWHFTLGARYSWDEKQGYEQEVDVYWIPLVATQAQAQALGFPTYPSNWPIIGDRGQYVQDYVGVSCSSPGVDGIMPYSATTECPAHRHLRDQWGAPTGTAGVEWTPDSDTNVYVRYNRGYKSGGFNLGPLAAQAGGVGPEYIDDFEAGWKQTFMRTFQFDIAGFYYLYHGLQALNETTQNSSPPIQINELINIPQSHAYGVEFEARWSPIDNLVLALNYSYLVTSNDSNCTFTGTPTLASSNPLYEDAAYWTNLKETGCYVDAANPNAVTDVNGVALTGVKPVGPYFPSTPNNQPQSLHGDPLPYSPPHKVAANVSYTFNFEPGDLTLAGVWNWHDAFYDNLFPTQAWLVPAGQTTDFRITWASHGGRYQVIGSVSNAFNANVWISHQSLPPGNGYYGYNELQAPRIFSVELRYKF